jgi:HAMP domain-containing protein
MRITIRSKLILAISTLMVVIFAVAANLFINEKKMQMADDIFVNMKAFTKLTASTVADDYDLYLKENSFVYFNRDIKQIFSQNENVDSIKLISYSGEILYDSVSDLTAKYEGPARKVGEEFLKQIKSENISVKTSEGSVLFIKQETDGESEIVDVNDKVLAPMKSGTLIDYFVVPANDKYSAVYTLTYKHLDERIASMQMRIIYLALFAVMMGMILSFVVSANLVKPIKKLVIGADEIAKGNFDTRVDIRTHDETKLLGDAFNQMAVDLKKSIEAKIYKERVAHELGIAAEIQKRIIPKEDPKIEGLDISAGIIPATEIGGDMYDFLSMEDRLVMYVGDVTGHGVPAGIMSSIANALFFGYSGEKDLKKIISDVNRVMKAKSMTNMFMTLCLAEWHKKDKKFRFINAGHEQIIHYKAKDKTTEVISAKGIALGMVPEIEKLVEVHDIDFQVGDVIVMYTDGIPEAWKNEKELYGMDRLVYAVNNFGQHLETALAIKEAILSDVEQFVQGHAQMDDITVMVIRRVA